MLVNVAFFIAIVVLAYFSPTIGMWGYHMATDSFGITTAPLTWLFFLGAPGILWAVMAGIGMSVRLTRSDSQSHEETDKKLNEEAAKVLKSSLRRKRSDEF